MPRKRKIRTFENVKKQSLLDLEDITCYLRGLSGGKIGPSRARQMIYQDGFPPPIPGSKMRSRHAIDAYLYNFTPLLKELNKLMENLNMEVVQGIPEEKLTGYALKLHKEFSL